MPRQRRALVVLREVLIAFAVLPVFLFFGTQFLQLLHLSDLALQIAGAVVLFLIALHMIFPSGVASVEDSASEPLIVPLAIPSLAGPSAMATVMLLAAQAPQRRLEWVLALIVTMAVCALVLVLAERIQRWLGDRVVAAFERLMGLILVAIAVEMLIRGLQRLIHQM